MEFQGVSFEVPPVRPPISQYVYRALDHRRSEVRLVRLRQDSVLSGPIAVTLEHHSLLDPPEFVALSYEWGHPGQYQYITVDGINVAVTINLWMALMQLREHKWSLLWIDSLCIDQKSEDERSAQILRMAAIYQQAYKVAVWLGPQADGSHRVMAFLKSLHEAKRTGNNRFMDRAQAIPEGKRRELQAFFSRSYWTRVWIIQEIVVGSQVSIMCGRDVVEWEDLGEALSTSLLNEWERNLRLEECHRLCDLRSKDIVGAPMSLLQALHASSLSSSTERKDKVYGLLGLTFDRRVYLTEPQYGWTEQELCMRMTQSFISRKRSLDIIFIGAQDNPGRKLRLPSWCPEYTSFPSQPKLRHIIWYVSGQMERFRTGELGRRWKATDASVATKQTFRIESDKMWVQAIFIGSVAALASTTDSKTRRVYDAALKGGAPAGMESSKRGSLTRVYNEAWRGDPPASTSLSTGDALSRMLFLIYNKDYDRHLGTRRQNSPAFRSLLFKFDSNEFSHEKLGARFEQVQLWRDINTKFRINGKTLEERCPEYVSTVESLRPTAKGSAGSFEEDEDKDRMNAADLLLVATKSSEKSQKLIMQRIIPLITERLRKPTIDIEGSLSALSDLIEEGLLLMTTHKGDIGWAHPNVRIGDELFLMPGCSMPAILRKCRDEAGYRVVGHAYLDGVMDGIFWRSVISSQQPLQQICIM